MLRSKNDGLIAELSSMINKDIHRLQSFDAKVVLWDIFSQIMDKI